MAFIFRFKQAICKIECYVCTINISSSVGVVPNYSMYVKCKTFVKDTFYVTNSVRQGGVLSHLFFNVYINELSE